MEFAFPVVLFVLFAAVAAVFAYYAHLRHKQRQEDLAALAARLGWRFVPDKDYSHDDEYAHFEIFRRGHSRFAYNTLFGAADVDGQSCPAKMGDFHYQVTSSNGKTTTTHTYRFSYLIVHLPYARVPDLLIRREGIFDSLKSMFGFDDIDFESAEFSKRFFVKSPDKRFAYDVIHPAMMEYLMASDPPTIDIERGRCCLTDGSQTWTPQEFQSKLDVIARFFDLWPSHLTSTLEHS